jgi:hypothetical protein
MMRIFELVGISARTSLVWSKLSVLLLILTIVTYCQSPAADRRAFAAPPGPGLSFGQSLALTDFDGDHIIDRAILAVVGFSKSIHLSFSSNKEPSVLRFDTSSSSHGSLFARDIDHDGDIDLIWTDLINPDNVVVWLNDGTGQFERVCHRYSGDGFTLGTTTLERFSEQTRELAISSSNPTSADQALDEHSWFLMSLLQLGSAPTQVFLPSSSRLRLPGRGPPQILS